VAVDAGLPFGGIWLDAPESLLIEHVSSRPREASDADASVVREQIGDGVGDVRWQLVDASSSPSVIRESVRAITSLLEPDVGISVRASA
jgi:uncharacterized protein